MNKYRFVTGLVLAFSATSAMASASLHSVRQGCLATETYEDEAKCFRVGTQAVLYGNSERSAIRAMCLDTKTYKSEGQCQRAAIAVTSDYGVQAAHRTCTQYTTTWEQEVKCARDVLGGYEMEAQMAPDDTQEKVMEKVMMAPTSELKAD